MNPKIARKLWNAGHSDESYSEQMWKDIMESLIDDFKQLIKQDFEYSSATIDITNPHSPLINQWMWSEDRSSLLFPVWLAVMGGDMAGCEENGHVKELFGVGVTLFPFDVTTEKRLHLSTGESIFQFIFERQPDDSGSWRSLGWCMDIYGEWEDIEWS
ncbi:hypothetical protein [Roseofilum casamattae]|uniref:DUF1838 domain-containing protein n=1 Tax=Roseofilum casamattae BLCC-M143 TaxID=3022442 RepID=A0ABT7C2Y3_9CYAN|nr:hypothetical protein [Roseofilum casamattae]MDJ1185820.1 hypothetical protein [Roseofilum casamattae BLCC-M143]